MTVSRGEAVAPAPILLARSAKIIACAEPPGPWAARAVRRACSIRAVESQPVANVRQIALAYLGWTLCSHRIAPVDPTVAMLSAPTK